MLGAQKKAPRLSSEGFQICTHKAANVPGFSLGLSGNTD